MGTYSVQEALTWRKKYTAQGYKQIENLDVPAYDLVRYPVTAKDRRDTAREVEPLVPGQIVNPLEKTIEYIEKSLIEAQELTKKGIAISVPYGATEYVGYKELEEIIESLPKIPEEVHEDFLKRCLIPIVEHCNQKQEEENRQAEAMAEVYKNNLIYSGATNVKIVTENID